MQYRNSLQNFCAVPLTLASLTLVTQGTHAQNLQPLPPVPRGLVSGDILVTSEVVPCGLRVYSRSGVLKRQLSHPDWTTSGAGRYISIAHDRHIWVCDKNRYSDPGDHLSGEFYEFDPDCRFIRSFPVQLLMDDPFGVGLGGFCFGPRGTIFIVGGWQSGGVLRLLEIEPERGETINNWPLPPWLEPVDVEYGTDGLLYVSGYYGKVGQMDPSTGALIQTIVTNMGGTNLLEAKGLSSGKLFIADVSPGSPGSSGRVLLVDPALPEGQQNLPPVPFPVQGPYGLDVWGGMIHGGGVGGVLYILRASDGQVVSSFQVGQQGCSTVISSIAIVP